MTNLAQDTTAQLKKKDFETSNDVRWCPGCGDYSILATVQKLLPKMDIPKEKFVFVSGIGCSSRFPYYMNTYGFHSIHGRAPGIATGIKLANPDLSVWMITGDGDALSIGGNHIIHLLRRNVDINVLLFNNRIYGLTKGQYSPTSEVGKVTKSTPAGSVDHPVNPISLALGSDATFIARTVDVDAPHLSEVLTAAQNHRGTSFVEIYQNCIIFNDKAFDYVADRKQKVENQLKLVNGELLIYGKDRDKGIALDGLNPKVVNFTAGDESAAKKAGVIRFNSGDRNLAWLLSRLDYPEFPVPMGVIYQKERTTFDKLATEQITHPQKNLPFAELDKQANEDLYKLFTSGNTWTVS